MNWKTIEQRLSTLKKVAHGYSSVQRGIITLPDNKHVFVKIGVDDDTKQWAKKEIAVYAFLANHSFTDIPRFISHNSDHTAFALETLESNEGWNWSNEWTDDRLDA